MLIKKPFYKGLISLFLLNLCEFQVEYTMRQKMKKLFFTLGLFLIGIMVFGQKNLIQTDPDRLYKNGVELFNKEKYGAAQE